MDDITFPTVPFTDTTALFTQDLVSEQIHKTFHNQHDKKLKKSVENQSYSKEDLYPSTFSSHSPNSKPQPTNVDKTYEDQLLMEHTELPTEDLDSTLIVHGLPKKSESTFQKKLVKLLVDKYHIVPLLVGRFNRNETYWRVLFSSSSQAESMDGTTVNLVSNSQEEYTISFKRPISFIPDPQPAKRRRNSNVEDSVTPKRLCKETNPSDSKPEKQKTKQQTLKDYLVVDSPPKKESKLPDSNTIQLIQPSAPSKRDDQIIVRPETPTQAKEQLFICCQTSKKAYPLIVDIPTLREMSRTANWVITGQMAKDGPHFLVQTANDDIYWAPAPDCYRLIPGLVQQYYERAFGWKKLPFLKNRMNLNGSSGSSDAEKDTESGDQGTWETIQFI